MKHLLPLALFCTLYVLANPPIAIGQGSVADDRAALVALYDSTAGDNWANSTNWKSDRPLGEWYGVNTNTTGRVTVIILDTNQLVGKLPAELGNLTSLQNIWLPNNQLTGKLPSELGNLAKLKVLALHNNQLTGKLPVELGNLTKIEALYLNNNQLTGGGIPTELGNMTNLETLFLSSNQLTGEIPAEVGDLRNLETLLLSSNQLTGEIPEELGNLINLQTLVLANNQLTGEIPEDLANLANLKEINLSNNRLTGTIPSGLCHVESLNFAGNPSLIIKCFEVPEEFANNKRRLFNTREDGLLEFILLQENSHGKLWLSTDYFGTFDTPAEFINDIITYVFSSTPGDSTRGIFEYSIDILGTIRKNYWGENTGERMLDVYLHNYSWTTGIAGSANNRHIEVAMYSLKDSTPAVRDLIARVIAHEYAHGIHFGYAWPAHFIAEGLAEWSARDIIFDHANRPLHVVNYSNPDYHHYFEYRGLPLFPPFPFSYRRPNSLVAYMVERAGGIKPIIQICRPDGTCDPEDPDHGDWYHGLDGLDYAFSLLDPDLTFADIVSDFHTTNLVNDLSVTKDGVAYGYRSLKYAHPDYKIQPEVVIKFDNTYISRDMIEIRAGGVEYIRYEGVSDLHFSIATSDPEITVLRVFKEKGDTKELVDIDPGIGEYLVSGEYDRVTLIAVHSNARTEQPNITLDISARRNYVVSAEDEELPTVFALEQNYPNPFNPETLIAYDLPQTGHVRLAVYDMTGRMVATLVDGARPRGRHTERFDATGLSTGMYIYRLTAGGLSQTKMMTLVR